MIPIEPVLLKYGVEHTDRQGNQPVLCPFHDDSHTSASVNLEKGLFVCFTCGVGGDAIELLKIQEGLDFAGAKRVAEELAGEAGIEISREPDSSGAFLPRKPRNREGRGRWVSPWARNRP